MGKKTLKKLNKFLKEQSCLQGVYRNSNGEIKNLNNENLFRRIEFLELDCASEVFTKNSLNKVNDRIDSLKICYKHHEKTISDVKNDIKDDLTLGKVNYITFAFIMSSLSVLLSLIALMLR